MATTSDSTIDIEGWIIPVLVGLAGCVSINPYFLWSTHVGQLVVAATLSSAAIVWAIFRKEYRVARGVDALGVAVLTLFVVYITSAHREDGGHSKWVVVLPTLWALALLSDTAKERCLQAFITIFSVSLIPGIVVWILAVSGLHIGFVSMAPANPNMAPPGGGGLLYFPGALFSAMDPIVLKSGKVIFRMSGLFDEPGTVGTISALCLAAVRFRINNWRYALIYLAGILSFSHSFLLLAMVGFLAKSMFSRDWRQLLCVIPLLLALSLSLGWMTSENDAETLPTVATQSATAATAASGAREQAIPEHKGSEIASVDGEGPPKAQNLVHSYWSSGLWTRLFGISSDASVVKGGIGETFWRIFTDFGIVGFVTLAVGAACVVFPMWLRGGQSWWGVLFVAVFVMSFYQRPVIWLPYALVILFCGIPASSRDPQASAPPKASSTMIHRHQSGQ